MKLATERIQGIVDSLTIFRNLFDIVRVIDPVKKKVVNCGSQNDDSFTFICYDFWETGKQCDNCVSGRAITENDTFIKIECKGNEIFMVMASPVEVMDKNYIIEMIKNITHTDIPTGIDEKHIKESNRVITELNKRIVTDSLTCLYNWKYIHERLPAEICEATSNSKVFSVLMLDIDYFKHVNDTYGHPAGDTTLQRLSKIMQDHIRKDTDWAARYGGEEFFIFLKDADSKVAYRVSEKIRKVIEKEAITYDRETFSVTISIGAYTVKPGTENPEEVIQQVDHNLYQAKYQGRNRTVSS